MNEKNESELREILDTLNSEKNKIKELNNLIYEKVNQFHASDIKDCVKDDQPSAPGIIGQFKDLIKELAYQRELMELTLKELSCIV